jgi:hypothetical protein
LVSIFFNVHLINCKLKPVQDEESITRIAKMISRDFKDFLDMQFELAGDVYIAGSHSENAKDLMTSYLNLAVETCTLIIKNNRVLKKFEYAEDYNSILNNLIEGGIGICKEVKNEELEYQIAQMLNLIMMRTNDQIAKEKRNVYQEDFIYISKTMMKNQQDKKAKANRGTLESKKSITSTSKPSVVRMSKDMMSLKVLSRFEKIEIDSLLLETLTSIEAFFGSEEFLRTVDIEFEVLVNVSPSHPDHQHGGA